MLVKWAHLWFGTYDQEALDLSKIAHLVVGSEREREEGTRGPWSPLRTCSQ